MISFYVVFKKLVSLYSDIIKELKNKSRELDEYENRCEKLEEEKNNNKINDIKDTSSDINFGSQIRSYILHPYSLVKDHRTNIENNQPQVVLDGDLDEFLITYLQWLKKGDENV